ncbi:MAG: DUF2341 domain-containing protein, partial [Verrucomicrobiota bacterium]
FSGINSDIIVNGYQGVVGPTDRTISAWIRTLDDNGAIATWGNNAPGQIFELRVQSDNGTAGAIRTDVNGGFLVHNRDIREDTWHHAVVSWGTAYGPDITDARLYLDGRQGQSASFNRLVATQAGQDVRFGNDFNNRRLNGALDEIRISSVIRSADWVEAEFLNMASNEVFNRLEAIASPAPGLIPSVDAITPDSADVSGVVTQFCSSFDLTLYYGTTDGGTNPGSWDSAVPAGDAVSTTLPLSGLLSGQTYFFSWRLTTPDHVVWSGAPRTFTTEDSLLTFNGPGPIPDVGGATLTARLVRGEPATVKTYWGTSNGGNDIAQWDHVIDHGNGLLNRFYSNEVTGLLYGREYFVTAYATNAFEEDWAGSQVSFFTLPPVADPINNLPAANITPTSALLQASFDGSGAIYTVTAYWGPINGGNNPHIWAQSAVVGTFTNHLAFLNHTIPITPDIDMYFTWGVSNPATNRLAQPSESFIYNTPLEIAHDGVRQGQGEARILGALTAGINTRVFAFWGDEDGGIDPGAWDHVVDLGFYPGSRPVSTVVTGLLTGVTYYYRLRAINPMENMWADETGAFVAKPSLRVQLCGYDRTARLENFPLLLRLRPPTPGFDYADFLSPEGHDLRFWSSNLTRELNYEIETWDPGGSSWVWVQAPEITDSNTTLWITSGHSDQIHQPAYTTNGEAWNPHYLSVWHLAHDFGSGVFPDSASDNDATDLFGSDTSTTGGRIGQGQFFDGNTDGLVVANESAFDFTEEMSISVWLRVPSFNKSWQTLVGKGEGTTWRLRRHSSSPNMNWRAGPSSVFTTQSVEDGRWHHLVANKSITNGLEMFLDGVRVRYETNATELIGANDLSVRIGQSPGTGNSEWYGGLDELRISSSIRSTNWVWAEWMSVASNSTLNCFIPADGMTVSNEAPTDVTEITATLNGTLVAPESTAHVWFYYGPDNGGRDPAGWSNAVSLGWFTGQVASLSHDIEALTSNTTYFYSFRATNAVEDSWPNASSFTTPAATNRLTLRFCAYPGGEVLNDFPALIRLDADFIAYGTFGSPTGGDLRFFDQTYSAVLPYEIERWNTNGESLVWVRVPQLEDSNTCVIAAWGAYDTNAPAYTTNGAVWEENFLMVHHLQDGADDSTSNRLNGTAGGAVGGNGTVGQGRSFDGDDDWINFGDVDALDEPTRFTVSMWFNRRTDSTDSTSHNNENVLVGQASMPDNDNLEVGTSGSTIEIYLDTQDRNRHINYPATVTDGQWHHFALTYDAARPAEAEIFLDGQRVATETDWGGPLTPSASSPLSLGLSRPDDQQWGDFDGRIDEFRISRIARSSHWLHTAWLNTASNQTLICYPEVELTLSKTVNAAELISGSNLVYTIVVSNPSARAASGVVVTDALPAHVSFQSATPPPDAMNGNNAVWHLGPLPAGSNLSVQLNVSVDSNAVSTLTNRAFAGSPDLEVNLADGAETTLPDFDNDGLKDFVDEDDDNDRVSDEDEALADTDPRDPDAFLWLRAERTAMANVQQLTFPSSANRAYFIQARTNLMVPPWETVETNIPGTGGMIVFPQTNNLRLKYFRVGVTQPSFGQ